MPEKRLSVVPPVVTSDDLEDFLATDDLFIDYFNAFLQLPTFPEPLAFNKERGGFEVTSNARSQLKSKLHSVVRAQRKRKPIYDAPHGVVAERHPPKMPWHHEEVEEPELKTSFSVRCLNKEQGIQWIKEERLPSFLKSDYYLEYRLAKLISQTEIAPKGSDAPLHLYIDPEYAPFAIEKPVAEAEVIVDTKQLAMKNMFVCMGEAAVTQSDDWFSQVKLSSRTCATASLTGRPPTAVTPENWSFGGSVGVPTKSQNLISSTGDSGGVTGISDRLSIHDMDSMGNSRPLSGNSSGIIRPLSGCSGGIVGKRRPLRGVSTGVTGISDRLSIHDVDSMGNSRPLSGNSGGIIRPLSGCSGGIMGKPRPLSGVSSGFGDSGIWSLGTQDTHSVTFENELPNHNQLLQSPVRPRSPPAWRPPVGDDVCVVADGAGWSGYISGVADGVDRCDPKECKTEFGTNRLDQIEEPDSEEKQSRCCLQDDDPRQEGIMLDRNDGTNQDKRDIEDEGFAQPVAETVIDTSADTITVYNLDRVATLIVSHMMKTSLRDIFHQSTAEIDSYLDEHILVGSGFNAEQLDGEWMERIKLAPKFGDSESDSLKVQADDPVPEMERSVSKVSIAVSSEAGTDNSDENSLFDSDVDDDSSEPGVSSKGAETSSDLHSLRGIEAFKKFLRGTAGERYWSLWLDVSKGRNIHDLQVLQVYLSQLREKYLQPGGPCELSPDLRDSLGLGVPSKWTSLPKLVTLQDKLIRPLLLYWAPRFLMNSTYQCHQRPSYHQQRLAVQTRREISQKLRTKPLLPLRPKTCVARIRTGPKSCSGTSSRKASIPKPPRPKSAVDVRRGPPLLLHRSSSSKPPPNLPAQPRQGGESNMIVSDSTCQQMSSIDGKGDAKKNHLTESSKSVPTSYEDNAGDTKEDITGETAADMGALSAGLNHEERAGGYFMGYLQKHGNQVLVNALNCWHEVQDYNTLFNAEAFSPYVVARRAEEIHSKFIVDGAPFPIGCPVGVQAQVYREVIPPFEELYDAVGEHILRLLLEPWKAMKESDRKLYDKIHLTSEERQLEGVTSSHIQKLQRRLNRERMMTPDFHIEEEDVEGKREAHYNSIEEKVPAEYKDYDYNKLIHNRLELEHFRAFLGDNYALTDLLCWLDIESFRRTSHLDSTKRDQKARDIKTKYLNKKYFFGPNSPATRKQQNEVMMSGGGWGKLLLDRTPTPILLEAQKYVRERLERKWLPLFVCTEEFQTRQRPNVTLGDLTDDMLLNRRKRSQAIYKILESRWVSSSREISSFRQALQNPVTCQQFRKFVSVKGENLENDVLFWLEVQKFKDMYHDHTEESLLHQKIGAIIRCFIDSEIHPGLHIDITPEQVEKILDKRPREMGPYVFRDAQLTVFRVLFSHWSDFLKYRNTIADDKLLHDLERKKRRRKKKEEQQRRLEEEKDQKAGKSDGDSLSLRRVSHSTGISADFLDGEESEEEKVRWKYSDYIRGLEREGALLEGDGRADSIMTSIESMAGSQHGGEAVEMNENLQSTGAIQHVQTPGDSAKKRVSLAVPTSKGRRRGSRPKSGVRLVAPEVRRGSTEIEGSTKLRNGAGGTFTEVAKKPGGMTKQRKTMNTTEVLRPLSSKVK